MIPFKAPKDDIQFFLAHVVETTGLEDRDVELMADMLGHFAGFAEGVIAPLAVVGDVHLDEPRSCQCHIAGSGQGHPTPRETLRLAQA